jgi:hypothetical protein
MILSRVGTPTSAGNGSDPAATPPARCPTSLKLRFCGEFDGQDHPQ